MVKIKRDRCWLTKKVDVEKIKTFSIQNIDRITDTIVSEMNVLFSNVSRKAHDSDLLFELTKNFSLGTEGFSISNKNSKVIIHAQTTKGLLYGMFFLHRSLIENNNNVREIISKPDQSLRMINHWDNMDGTIERGYAGNSIFFKDNDFRRDYDLVREYARLLSSVGINAVTLNNVNVRGRAIELICEENLGEVKMLNDIFSSYGIQTFLCVNFASPKIIGGLDTADPLDKSVIEFWNNITKKIYKYIPDFGGFVIKADSEGEPGPFEYGRKHDEGANLFGRALEPYGGRCIWRCFVYNHKQDWRDRSTDRAKAAYEEFMPLDGKFIDNVSLQIKLGPLDFQVREPVSPLLGSLRNTNYLIEFQLTQEYTGHQKSIYYQVPVWKEALDFDCKYEDTPGTVKELIRKNSPIVNNSGICAVGLVGMDSNWTGNKLMQINLFAYGLLSWNNNLSSEIIADEWIDLTFSLGNNLKDKLREILLTSRETYAMYTAPRGVGFMVRPVTHDGPSIDGYEYDKWGTYHFADWQSIGNDRTKNGTGFVKQYSPEVCEFYDNLETCPDNLLLWFHHVPYTHILHNGKSLIQDIYDNHFVGVDRVKQYQIDWQSFEGKIDENSYYNVKSLLSYQLKMAIEWRDQINTYFYRKTGISDIHGRKIYS